MALHEDKNTINRYVSNNLNSHKLWIGNFLNVNNCVYIYLLRSSFGMWTAFARWCHDWLNIGSNFIEGSMSNSLCLILEHQCYIYVLNLKQLINIYSLYIIYIYMYSRGFVGSVGRNSRKSCQMISHVSVSGDPTKVA